MNEIDVFSASTETETAAIPVPTPMGIDISPVDGSLWAGTVLGDVYKIDTAKLSVIARYPADGFGPKGFSASAALVLADGRLAPSIMPDVYVDDHGIHIDTIKEWAVSESGLQSKGARPQVYANVIAHLIAHQQALSQQQPVAAEAAAPKKA